MKKYFSLLMCVIVLILCLLCTGCKAALQNFDNKEIRQTTEAMLDALVSDDHNGAYALVSEICTEDDFSLIYKQMQDLLGETDTYELNLLSIYTNFSVNNGQKTSTTTAQYELTSENVRLVVSVQVDGENRLTNFYLTPYENTDYYSTGTLENIKELSAVQWLFLLTNVVTIGITLFAFVDCCRHKVRKKVLWILILIFGFVTIGATISATGFNFNFNVGNIMAYSALIRYGSGTLMLRLMLPVGAICYFIARRSFLRPKTNQNLYGDPYSNMK